MCADRDFHHEGTGPFERGNSMPVRMETTGFWNWLIDITLKPLYNWPEDRPGGYKIALVVIWTILASFFYGVFYLAAGHYLFSAAIANASFILALLTAGFTFVAALLTYETDFRMIPNPMLSFARVTSRDIGWVPMLILSAASFGGFAAAGGVAVAVGWTDINLVDAPTTTSAAALLSWLAGTIMCLFLTTIDHFELLKESENSNHIKAFGALALVLFLSFIAFFQDPLVLRTYNPALYLGAAIATGTFNSGTWALSTWAWFIFFMWFVPPLTSMVVYWINYYFTMWDKQNNPRRVPTEDRRPLMSDSESMEYQIQSNAGPYTPESQQMRITSSRLRKRIPAK